MKSTIAALFLVSVAGVSGAFAQSCNPATGLNCGGPTTPPAPVCTVIQRTCTGGNPAYGLVGTCVDNVVVVPCQTPPATCYKTDATGKLTVIPCT